MKHPSLCIYQKRQSHIANRHHAAFRQGPSPAAPPYRELRTSLLDPTHGKRASAMAGKSKGRTLLDPDMGVLQRTKG